MSCVCEPSAGFSDLTITDDLSSTDVDANGASPLVEYDRERDQWIPLCSPCRTPIPTFPTSEAKMWAQKRLDLADIDRNIDRRGMMTGPPCMPKAHTSCPKCGASTRDALRVEKQSFVMRTYRGAVVRRVFDVQCASCRDIRSWDPYSECILSINEGREGGECPHSNNVLMRSFGFLEVH